MFLASLVRYPFPGRASGHGRHFLLVCLFEADYEFFFGAIETKGRPRCRRRRLPQPGMTTLAPSLFDTTPRPHAASPNDNSPASNKLRLSDIIREAPQCQTKIPQTTPKASARRRESANETETSAPEAPPVDLTTDGEAAASPALFSADPLLVRLTDSAKAYARAARSENTARAYEFDWRQFAS